MPDKDPNAIERRAFIMDVCKVETRTEGEPPRIVGHAAVFDQLSENLGGFRELIKPGAFTAAINEDDVRALFNHNPDFILGRSKSGTLSMKEDALGLAIEITPPDTQIARDLLVSMERGDINQMSFGFRVKAGGQDWGEDADGNVIRTLTDLKLFDVSPVTFAAYPQTDAAVRSLHDYRAQKTGHIASMQRHKHKLSMIERRV
jgi:HK97 family phage prohead protease